MVNFDTIINLMHESLQKNAVFGQLLSKLDREFLLNHGIIRTAQADEILCSKNTQEHSLFLLITGRVEISTTVNGKSILLTSLHSGEIFGEISALFMTPRIATATAAVPSVLLEIPREIMNDLMEQAPVIRKAILHRYQKRTLETTIQAVPLFSELSSECLAPLIENSKLTPFEKDTPILKEKEMGDYLYIINYGVAKVHIDINGHPLNFATLRNGDYFGEWSLLSKSPRVASVTSLTKVELVTIEGAAFVDFIQSNPTVAEKISNLAEKRKNQTHSLYSWQIKTTEEISKMLKDMQSIMSA